MQRIGLQCVILFLLMLAAGVARAQEATPTPTPTGTASAIAGTPSPSAEPVLIIRSPGAGQAVQGSVSVEGGSSVPGFVSAELEFAYAGDPTGTWFLIAEASQPVQDGVLAQWDTGAITDGDYNLRLRVLLQNGNHIETLVPGLRVRNYTPVETDTPTPVTPTLTQVPGETPVVTPTREIRPTPTPLPPNPAEITSSDLLSSLGKGALAILGLFALLGAYRLVQGIRDRG
jgi:hypothetical protein